MMPRSTSPRGPTENLSGESDHVLFQIVRELHQARRIARKTEMEAHLKTSRGRHECTPEKVQELIQQILEDKSAAPI